MIDEQYFADLKQLVGWLNVLSVKKGEEFTLASGAVSNIYINVKKTALHRRVHKILARLLYDKMMARFPPAVGAVAGVALGGCHLASIVAMHSPLPMDVLHIRKEAKDHGTKSLVECPVITEMTDIVLLEDVVTTGGSSIAAAKAIEAAGYNVVGILAVVDRRTEKKDYLGSWQFSALVNFEELDIE